jgi:superoxide reductase
MEENMTARLEMYKCELCGNIVGVMHAGPGELVCCGQPMVCLKENSVDAAVEKHVPVIEKIEGGVKVKVGSVAHPMQEDHYIEWIEIIADGKSYRQFLKPGDAPEAVFMVDAANITAKEFCNLHGYWKSA